MNWKYLFAAAMLLVCISSEALAQSEAYSFIPSSSLEITCNKTTNLVFPFAVQSVDRGSKDILIQQPKGTQNIVQLKADKPNFTQTNLSVITVDGSLYAFTIDYASQPAQLNVVVKEEHYAARDSVDQRVIKLSVGKSEALFKKVAQKIDATRMKKGKRISRDQVQLRIGGVYINNDIVYLRLQLKNASNISYDVDNIRFSIKDRQKSKRIATQELELTPLYTYNWFSKVLAEDQASCIIAIPKFTLADSKYLSISISEKTGSRDLHMKLKERYLERAMILPD